MYQRNITMEGDPQHHPRRHRHHNRVAPAVPAAEAAAAAADVVAVGVPREARRHQHPILLDTPAKAKTRRAVADARDRLRRNDPSLTELHLPFLGHLPADDVELLLDSLASNSRLERLVLDHNSSGGNNGGGGGDDPGAALATTAADRAAGRALRSLVEATILRAPSSLTSLSIAHCDVGDVEARWIGQALANGDTLTELNLRGNLIGPDGVRDIVRGIRENRSLEILCLSDNVTISSGWAGGGGGGAGCEKGACAVLASVLGDCSLKVLDLSSCSIGDAGAVAISYGLGRTKTLTRLSLNSNGVGDAGCRAVARALRRNCSLIELSLYGNGDITRAGASELEASLTHLNYSLEMIYLDWNDRVSCSQRDRVRALCDANRGMKKQRDLLEKQLLSIPLGLWPEALELVQSKPDLLYSVLKSKPEIARRASSRSAVQGKATCCSCSIL